MTATHPDSLSFLAAIADAPEDDTARGAYADWLDEHDDHDRAEFIRVQCEIWRLMDRPARDAEPLLARERELLDRHRALWLPRCPVCQGKGEIISHVVGHHNGVQFEGAAYREDCSHCKRTGHVGSMSRGFLAEVRAPRLADVVQRVCAVCLQARKQVESITQHGYCARCDANGGPYEWLPTPWACALRDRPDWRTVQRVFCEDRVPLEVFDGVWCWSRQIASGDEPHRIPDVIFNRMSSAERVDHRTADAATRALAEAVTDFIFGRR